ncbi:AhpC/TSA antioxidant enzyme-domain-containing protein [Apiosordaria backusii]|uniref:AhpC/TSA antioxidant enzyme-domain-containing protein n=1 Tax=Apiosordaria backusii TaxID=314023 RepID=A0AA40BTB3_9PEZI|nr:AhpC/TSA antioxidant enzyme-domain-containing protein [Apiosordaria backusii]
MASPTKDLAPGATTVPNPAPNSSATPPPESGVENTGAKPETNTLGGAWQTEPKTTTTTTTTTSDTPGAPASSAPSKPENGGSGSSVQSGDKTATTADIDTTNPLDFSESVAADNSLPSLATLKKIDNYIVLDRNGKSHTFRSLYTGRHVARRVLLVFVRHFYCGNCQDYLRTLSSAFSPSDLLGLPIPTFIVVIGCGDPGLIDMYTSETGCPFPVYTDPTRKLYAELGMIRTLALGERPAYTKTHLVKSSLASVVQGLKQIPKGLAHKGGDSRQIGGEFLFEPVEEVASPIKELGEWKAGNNNNNNGQEPELGVKHRASETPSIDGKNMELGGDGSEGVDKIVSWCHRMRNTRDHAEVPELMEIFGMSVGEQGSIPENVKGEERERWVRAVRERKGVGLGGKGRGSLER